MLAHLQRFDLASLAGFDAVGFSCAHVLEAAELQPAEAEHFQVVLELPGALLLEAQLALHYFVVLNDLPVVVLAQPLHVALDDGDFTLRVPH
jgi:hypothetical protein